MRLTILALLQAVAGPPVPADLRKSAPHPAAAPCTATAAHLDEVFVCAPPRVDQRLVALPDIVTAPDNPLDFRLPGGGRAAAHAMQSTVGGFTAPGAAFTLTVPFGRRTR